MNHSLYSADRATHLKVVVLALFGAVLVAGIGVGARLGASDNMAAMRSTTAPVKAEALMQKAPAPLAGTMTNAVSDSLR